MMPAMAKHRELSIIADLLETIPPDERARIRVIHAHPCQHCPSAHSERHDPETEDILGWTDRDAQLDTVFRCAWRTKKACRGYCDVLGVTEAELNAFADREELQ